MYKILKYMYLFAVLFFVFSCGNSGGSSGGAVNNNSSGQTSAYYAFDENSGTTAFNSDFDDLNGEISGATRVSGVSANALNFSAGSYVFFDICCYANPLTGAGGKEIRFPQNKINIETWIKPTGLESGKRYLLFGGTDFGVQSSKLIINDGYIQFIIYQDSQLSQPMIVVSSSTQLLNDIWYELKVTYDNTEGIIYIDGIEDNRNPITIPIPKIVNDYYIGGAPSVSSNYLSFLGIIDEFRFSNFLFVMT